MRSKTCTSCGSRFMTADPTIIECQDCSGEGLPQPKEEPKREPKTAQQQTIAMEDIKAAIDGAEDKQQTVSLESLRGDSSSGDAEATSSVGPEGDGAVPAPKRRRKRKQSAPADDGGEANGQERDGGDDPAVASTSNEDNSEGNTND